MSLFFKWKKKSGTSPPKRKSGQAGSIFTVLLAGIAMASALSLVLYQTISGPMSSMVRVTNKTSAKATMQSVANITIMNAVTAANNGDCDADGSVEPIQWRTGPGPSLNPGSPAGGGLIPLTIGAPVTDPWGTDYGYCVWDVGSVQTKCSGANMRLGSPNPTTGNAVSQTVIAIISAGPNRRFETTCRDYANNTIPADANTDLICPTTGGCTASVGGAGGDDIVLRFTYAAAASALDSLWSLKVGTPTSATIGKNIEVGSPVKALPADISADTSGVIRALAVVADGRITAGGAIQPGLSTGATPVTSCAAANAGDMRYNTALVLVQVCNGTGVGGPSNDGWINAAGAGGGGGRLDQITAATANGTLQDSAAYPIIWNWNALTSGSGLSLGSNATSATTGQTVLNVSTTGVNTGIVTSYGAQIANTHSGGTATNVGLYATASGGTNNYAALFNGGSVGIGTTAPTHNLGFTGQADQTLGPERETTAATAGNRLTINAGGAVSGGTDLAGGDLYLTSGTATGNGSSRMMFQTVQTWQGTGTTDRVPATSMILYSNVLLLPVGATTTQPGQANMQASVEGMIRYNSTTHAFEGYSGSTPAWSSLAGAGGGSLDAITAAVANQTGIANGAHTIVWNWDTLATNTNALTLGSASTTLTGTASILNIAASGAAANTGAALKVSNTTTGVGYGITSTMTSGTTDAGVAGYFSQAPTTATTANWALYGTNNNTGTFSTTTGASSAVSGLMTAAGNTGAAVYANNASTGAGYGVYSTTAATGAGAAIYGVNTSSGVGGYFTSTSGYALITGTGNVGIGTTAPTELLHVQSTAVGGNGTDTEILNESVNAAGITAAFTGARARGTPGAKTAVQSGDVLAAFNGHGYGATAYSTGNPGMKIQATQTWTDTAQGAAIRFKTMPNGSAGAAAEVESMRIDQNGNVGIGTTAPTNILSFGNGAARELWIENSATDVVGRALTIAGGGTVAGTAVNDVAGGNLILQSGLGTGAGASSILFQTGLTLGSGLKTLQTMTTAMSIFGSGNVSTAGTVTAAGKLFGQIVNTAFSADAATQLTAAAMVGGMITRSGMTAIRADTTDTAAHIIAAIPNVNTSANGTSFYLYIKNTTGFTNTLTNGGDANVNIVATTANEVANATTLYLVQVTSATTVTMTKVDVAGVDTSGGSGGASTLDAITAAVGAQAGISNADNAIVWNWAMTTAVKTAFKFGESAASTGGGGSQYLTAFSTSSGSTATPMLISNALTGSQTLPTLSITPNWNTTGVVDAGLLINVTNTASATGSKIIDAQVGGTSTFSLQTTVATANNGSFLNLTAPAQTLASLATANYAAATFTAPTITMTGNTTVTSRMDSFIFNPATYTEGSGETINDAATMAINTGPSGAGGGPVTITNSYGLRIPNNAMAHVTNGYGMRVSAPTGATTNYAAAFDGGNVGIGTKTPVDGLDVEGTVQDMVQFGSSNTTGTAVHWVATGAGGSSWEIDSTANASGDGGGKFKISGGAVSGTRLIIDGATGSIGFGTNAPTALLHLVPPVASVTPALRVTGPVNTTNNATTVEVPDVDLVLNRVETWATGALATQRAVKIAAPTYAFAGASTITDAASLGITGAPIKGTNTTFTNTHALLIGASAVVGAGSSYGLTVNAQTGATANYAAQFIGGNVGIGTAAPANSLDVVGNIRTSTALLITPVAGNAPTYAAASTCSNALTYAATTAVDWSVCNVNTMTFGAGNTTFTFANPVAGARYILIVKQDATGSRTVTWPATVRWPGGTAPTLTTTASKTDYFGFIYNGVDSKYDGVAISQNF